MVTARVKAIRKAARLAERQRLLKALSGLKCKDTGYGKMIDVRELIDLINNKRRSCLIE